MVDTTLVATLTKVDEWVQVESKKRCNALRENRTLQRVARKLLTGHSDMSFVFHKMKECERSEPKTPCEDDIGLIKHLLNQLMPRDNSGVTLLKM